MGAPSTQLATYVPRYQAYINFMDTDVPGFVDGGWGLEGEGMTGARVRPEIQDPGTGPLARIRFRIQIRIQSRSRSGS